MYKDPNLVLGSYPYPRLIASLTCAILLRETGSDSWQCLMSNWMEPECETICST